MGKELVTRSVIPSASEGTRMKPIEDKIYAVYIMTDKGNNVLYTGMTGDLPI